MKRWLTVFLMALADLGVLLFMIFVVLKLAGLVAWHWIWVLSPAWMLIGLLAFLWVVVSLLGAWVDRTAWRSQCKERGGK